LHIFQHNARAWITDVAAQQASLEHIVTNGLFIDARFVCLLLLLLLLLL